MPIQLTGFASVEPLGPDLSPNALGSGEAKTREHAARALAQRYDALYREEPRAATLVKSQWAMALLPGRSRACRFPKQARNKIANAELAGVYFGLYCNPPHAEKSVHVRLRRTLADILAEAPIDDGSLLAGQLAELLAKPQEGGTLGERAAIWGAHEDTVDLLAFLKRSTCGTATQLRDMRASCVQTSLAALLAHCEPRLHDAPAATVNRWSQHALTLIENGAQLETNEQLDALTLLATFGDDMALFERLPATAFEARRMFISGEDCCTLAQWLLSRRGIPECKQKLRAVLQRNTEPLWYPKGDRSLWLDSMAVDNGCSLAFMMLGVVGADHQDPYTGMTPLHIMAGISDCDGAWRMLAALLMQHADPDARDFKGRTAAQMLKNSCFISAVQAFARWYPPVQKAVSKFCELTQQGNAHWVVGALLRQHEWLSAESAMRVVTACCGMPGADGKAVTVPHTLAFMQDAVTWMRRDPDQSRGVQERLATLQLFADMGVGESVIEHRRQLTGTEWRILRMFLSHMKKAGGLRDAGLWASGVIERVNDNRFRNLSYLCAAVRDLGAMPLNWFGDKVTFHHALTQMTMLNRMKPGVRSSSAFIRLLKSRHSFKVITQPTDPTIEWMDCTQAETDIHEEFRAMAGSKTILSFVAGALRTPVDFTPLFCDEATAEAIVCEDTPARPAATPEPAGKTTPPGASTAPGSTKQSVRDPCEPSPASGASPSPKATPATEAVAGVEASVHDAALEDTTREIFLPVVAQGVAPLLRDLNAGRLSETDLRPLGELARTAAGDDQFLQGPACLFETSLALLRDVAGLESDEARASVAVVRRRIDLVAQALHDELLHGVISGTAGIGETERMQRATKRLVARCFVQVLGCALGDEFALVYLGNDAQARAAAIRKLMFRVAPDKSMWARKHADVAQAVQELFQLVSGFKSLHEHKPQFQKSLVTLFRRPTAR